MADDFVKVNNIYFELELLKTMLLQVESKLRLEENKKEYFISPIRIIDKPKLAERKFKPKRKILLIVIFMASFIINISGILIYEYLNSLPGDVKEKLKEIFFIRS